jgi:hypothetical protein
VQRSGGVDLYKSAVTCIGIGVFYTCNQLTGTLWAPFALSTGFRRAAYFSALTRTHLRVSRAATEGEMASTVGKG